MRFPVTLSLFLALAPVFAKSSGDLDAVLARVDKAGAGFRGMSADVRRLSHTAIINEDNIDSGTMVLKRPRSHDMRMLVDLKQPDPRTVAFQGHKLEVYYPKILTVQEFDVGKSRELLDEFFLLGFGTSRAELEEAYNIRLVGTETIAGQKSDRLELIPKSKEVLQHLKKFEMWISDAGYPVQQKFYLPGDDFMLVTYTGMKTNANLSDAALKLQLPKGVKREFPQK